MSDTPVTFEITDPSDAVFEREGAKHRLVIHTLAKTTLGVTMTDEEFAGLYRAMGKRFYQMALARMVATADDYFEEVTDPNGI